MKLYKMHGILFQVQLLRSLTFFHLQSLKDNLILLLFVIRSIFELITRKLSNQALFAGCAGSDMWFVLLHFFFVEHYAFFSFKQKAIP